MTESSWAHAFCFVNAIMIVWILKVLEESSITEKWKWQFKKRKTSGWKIFSNDAKLAFHPG